MKAPGAEAGLFNEPYFPIAIEGRGHFVRKRPVWRKRQIGEPAQDQRDGNPPLCLAQLCAEAEMRTATEREMLNIGSFNIEFLRIRIKRGIVMGPK